ncbi:MAG: D-alanine--D-alanine ligase, partial [Acetobacter malorum]
MTQLSTSSQPRTAPTPSGQTGGKPSSPLSSFEFWPGWAFYTPVVIYWILLGIRYGDFSTPTAANPRIETGGLCGESKSGILDMA